MSDSDFSLNHDHGESFNHLARLLGELLAQTNDEQRPTTELFMSFQEALDAMCSEVDFVTEETSLFPLIQQTLPDLAPKVERVLQTHQVLDDLVAMLAKELWRNAENLQPAIPKLTGLVRQFLIEFERHAEVERALLQQARSQLSPEQQRMLHQKFSRK